MNDLIAKLNKVAKIVAKQRPTLHFFGLVHRTNAPNDRWDLLVSSDGLDPWTMESLRYLVDQLKNLTPEERIRISMVVALPKDNPVILALTQNGVNSSAGLDRLRPADDFDAKHVLWPPQKSRSAA